MSAPRCCAFCGSTKNVEEHHLGGRNMRYTSDRSERLRRIVMASTVLMWQACKHSQGPEDSNPKREK